MSLGHTIAIQKRNHYLPWTYIIDIVYIHKKYRSTNLLKSFLLLFLYRLNIPSVCFYLGTNSIVSVDGYFTIQYNTFERSPRYSYLVMRNGPLLYFCSALLVIFITYNIIFYPFLFPTFSLSVHTYLRKHTHTLMHTPPPNKSGLFAICN